MYLFNKTPIQTRFEKSDKEIQSELNKITDKELLSSDLEKIADRIVQQYSIVCDAEFSTEDVKINSHLISIPIAEFPLEQQVGARHEYYEVVAVDYTFKINGDHTFLLNMPTNRDFSPIRGQAGPNELTLTVVTKYTRIPLSEEWEKQVKDTIKRLVPEVKARINILKEECEIRNVNIKPNVLSILEKEKRKLIAKMEHDAKLNPFK